MDCKMGERYFDFNKEKLPKLPDYIECVTAGNSGESFLIFGEEKTVLYDCGMAYCAQELLENISASLARHGKKTVDIMIISHSHFDHIGALPYVKKAYPKMTVCAALKCQKVFERPNARALIKKLGEDAREQYGNEAQKKREIESDGFCVDEVIETGSKIYIGPGHYLDVLETKGHTDCSITYILQPENLMFVCESTGVLKRGDFGMHTAAVKSPVQCIESAKLCKNYGPRQIISIHFGIIGEEYTNRYFDTYIDMATDELRAIASLHREGKTQDEIVDAYQEAYYNEARREIQPLSAFRINAVNLIKTSIEEIEAGLFTP